MLVGVGGIASGADAYAKIRAGASWCSFTPRWSIKVRAWSRASSSELLACLARDGYANVTAAVGCPAPIERQCRGFKVRNRLSFLAMEAKASANRRELTKAQNRETILAAARQVFAELGFATATVRDIIRATPLASGTFYNYFKSKEEVYQALRDEQALRLRPRLREARLAATTAQEFFQASFAAFFAFVAENGRPQASPTPFAWILRKSWPALPS